LHKYTTKRYRYDQPMQFGLRPDHIRTSEHVDSPFHRLDLG
jgi:hypothetical protein